MSSESDINSIQVKCCTYYETGCESLLPEHMSGWWLTTDSYDGGVNSLMTVHYKHIMEKRPDIAIYMGLPPGFHFLLGGDKDHVWFDSDVAQESE